MAGPEVQHDSSARRFHCTVDGVPCVLDYHLASGVMTIASTRVPPAVGGRGIAATLTARALDTARVEGWRVVPACSYAATYIRRHPEYADLL